MQTMAADGITIIKRRHGDLYSDDVRDLVTASKCGRPKETLEDFVSRDGEDHFTCERRVNTPGSDENRLKLYDLMYI
ncbi:hypothetical protein Tco_1370106 [Tanacetum coccineum]